MSTLSPTWTTELDTWATALRAAGRTTETIRLRTYHVGRLGRWAGARGPWDLTLDDLLTWVGQHDAWSSETRRMYRASLRGFWRWGVLTERTTRDVAAGLPSVKPTPPNPRPAPPQDVVRAMRESDERVVLMIRLGVEVGLRRAEVAQVHSDDLTPDLLGWSLRVHGKGLRERTVPVSDSLARALRRQPPGWAFPGADGGHLSPRWVGKLVGRMLPHGVTMHALRHLCATELHAETSDLLLVQRLLGHASVATTQRYVRTDDAAMRAAVTARASRWVA